MAYTFATDEKNEHLGGNLLEGDPATFSPLVWQFLIDRFALSSVLDLGSGLGYTSKYFARKGLDVVAVDGMQANMEHAVYPTMLCDLTNQAVRCKVDLVYCVEVVEHIEETFLDNLLTSLCSGKFILITHALPGQGGYHHVNEQPTEYWIQKLEERQCGLLAEDTNRIRNLAAQEGGQKFIAQTGLLFVNKERVGI